jgi:ferredoxin
LPNASAVRDRRLQPQVDVEGDKVVGPLLHPIVAVLDRPEFDRFAANLQGGVVAGVGEAAGVLARHQCEGRACSRRRSGA